MGVCHRVCYILCLLLSLICSECLTVVCSCHIVTLVPLWRLDMEEVVTLLEPMMIDIVGLSRSPLVEVLEHSML